MESYHCELFTFGFYLMTILTTRTAVKTISYLRTWSTCGSRSEHSTFRSNLSRVIRDSSRKTSISRRTTPSFTLNSRERQVRCSHAGRLLTWHRISLCSTTDLTTPLRLSRHILSKLSFTRHVLADRLHSGLIYLPTHSTSRFSPVSIRLSLDPLN